MNKELARQYAKLDNLLDFYFDHVLLDLINEDFKQEYYQNRKDILHEILKDNQCCIQDGCDSILYTKHKDYDDTMILLMEHYFTVQKSTTDEFALYEVELLMIEHYMELCSYQKDDLGYWICHFRSDHFYKGKE